MSIFGRRGSRESGWNWSRPPGGARPPAPPPPPLLPLAGAALLFAAIAAALLAVWLAGGDEGPPQDATTTPVASATATPAATAEPTPTPLPTPSPPTSRTPSPTPRPTPEPTISLAAWDGTRWRSGPDLPGDAFREGQAVPFILRIADAFAIPRAGNVTIRYTCETLPFLSAFDRDSGSAPALAQDGPRSALPDSTVALPDDPATAADDSENGRLSLWGGSFGTVELVPVSQPGKCQRSLNVKLTAGVDTLYVLWSAVIGPSAADRSLPVSVTVRTPRGEAAVYISPIGIRPGP